MVDVDVAKDQDPAVVELILEQPARVGGRQRSQWIEAGDLGAEGRGQVPELQRGHVPLRLSGLVG
jgi:hypothetical protein